MPLLPDQQITSAPIRRDFDALTGELEARFPVESDDIADGAVGAEQFGVDYGTQFSTLLSVNGGATAAVGTANRLFYARIQVLGPATLTGIRYLVGATQSGTVRCALYDSAGARVANRTTNSSQPAALNDHKIDFDATYDALPGLYYGGLVFSSTTATTLQGVIPGASFVAGPGAGATATTVTPTTTLTGSPLMSTY